MTSRNHLKISEDTTLLAYGENPHQASDLYVENTDKYGIANAKVIQGNSLSYNNYLDADVGFRLVSEFDEEKSAVCAIIKHGTPCGVGLCIAPQFAYDKAYQCDPQSAFGGIVVFNCEIGTQTAEMILNNYTHMVVAPKFSKETIQVLKQKPNIKILETGGVLQKGEYAEYRSITGGTLMQIRNTNTWEKCDLKYYGNADKNNYSINHFAKFAFNVCKYVKSNGIVISEFFHTLGICGGQTSRVRSVRYALEDCKSRKNQTKFIMASDGFFPFPDAVEYAIDKGVELIIQPGGSKNDSKIIDLVEKHPNVGMIVTGVRQFYH